MAEKPQEMSARNGNGNTIPPWFAKLALSALAAIVLVVSAYAQGALAGLEARLNTTSAVTGEALGKHESRLAVEEQKSKEADSFRGEVRAMFLDITKEIKDLRKDFQEARLTARKAAQP